MKLAGILRIEGGVVFICPWFWYHERNWDWSIKSSLSSKQHK